MRKHFRKSLSALLCVAMLLSLCMTSTAAYGETGNSPDAVVEEVAHVSDSESSMESAEAADASSEVEVPEGPEAPDGRKNPLDGGELESTGPETGPLENSNPDLESPWTPPLTPGTVEERVALASGWELDGTILSTDYDISALLEDAGGKIYQIDGVEVRVTGDPAKTYTGLGFELSNGGTLILENVNIDNSYRSVSKKNWHTQLNDKTLNYYCIPMVKALDNADNRVLFEGENHFGRAQSETATRLDWETMHYTAGAIFYDQTFVQPMIQIEKNTALTLGGTGTLYAKQPLKDDHTAIIGTMGKSTVGHITIVSGTYYLDSNSEGSAIIGSGGGYDLANASQTSYGYHPNYTGDDRIDYYTNYDGSPVSTGGTIDITGGDIHLNEGYTKTTHWSAAIGAGRGRILVDRPFGTTLMPEDQGSKDEWERHSLEQAANLFEQNPDWLKDLVEPLYINITGGSISINQRYGMSRAIGGTWTGFGGLTNFVSEVDNNPLFGPAVPEDKVAVLDYPIIHIGGNAKIRNSNMSGAAGGIGSVGALYSDGAFDELSPGCDITIDGNAVIDFKIAVAVDRLAVIGGGGLDGPVNITIGDSAEVSAVGSGYGAAIGTGVGGVKLDLTIEGSPVINARSSGFGAAIGSGYMGAELVYDDAPENGHYYPIAKLGLRAENNHISITGGTIEASSTHSNKKKTAGPAIGYSRYMGGHITISGDADISAVTTGYAAAIGGDGFIELPPDSANLEKVKIDISGNPTIFAGKRIPSSGEGTGGWGAAIGSGWQGVSEITLSGSPKIRAYAGMMSSAIGGTLHGQGDTTVTVNLDPQADVRSLSKRWVYQNEDTLNRYMSIDTNGQADGAKITSPLINLRTVEALNLPQEALSEEAAIPGLTDADGSTTPAVMLEVINPAGEIQAEIPLYQKSPYSYAGIGYSLPHEGGYYIRAKNASGYYAYWGGDNTQPENFAFGVPGNIARDLVNFAQGHLFSFVAGDKGTLGLDQGSISCFLIGNTPLATAQVPVLTPNAGETFTGWLADTALTIDGRTVAAGNPIHPEDLTKIAVSDATPSHVIFTAAYDTVVPQPVAKRVAFNVHILVDGQKGFATKDLLAEMEPVLLAVDSTEIRPTKIDDNGFTFQFENVPAGEYTLTFTYPAGYRFAPGKVGSDALGDYSDTGSKVTVTDGSVVNNFYTQLEKLQTAYMLVYDVNGGNTDGPSTEMNLLPGEHPLNTAVKPTHSDTGGKAVVFIGWTRDKDTVIHAKDSPTFDASKLLRSVTIVGKNVSVYALWGYDENGNGVPDVIETPDIIEVTPKDPAKPFDPEDPGSPNNSQTTPNGYVRVIFLSGANGDFGKYDDGRTDKIKVAYDVKVDKTWAIVPVPTPTAKTGYQVKDGVARWLPQLPQDNDAVSAGIYTAQYEKLAEEKTAIITFRIVNGTWADGTTTDKQVTVTLSAGKGTLPASNIPAGMKAASGYASGAWDKQPNTAADGIIGSVTYTYAFHKSGSNGGDHGGGTTRYTLTYDSKGGTEYKKERYDVGTTVKLEKVPHREGYAFTGWYADEKLTQEISTIRMTGNKTVYAGWGKITADLHIPEMLNGDEHFAYIAGYTDGTVRPHSNITRAEVAMIFYRLLREDVRVQNRSSDNTFTDVTEGMWCNTAISTIAKLGIVKGRSASTFDPDAPITRAEFAAICSRFDTSNTHSNSSFTDIDHCWAKSFIERAAALGWVQGYTDGTFQPENLITRAEAISMINRVLGRLPEKAADLLPGMKVWPDNADPQAWYYLAIQEATNTHSFTRKDDGVHESWVELYASDLLPQ